MTTDPQPDVTIVVPVYRNSGTLSELTRRLRTVMEGLAQPYELLFVDDASPDDSLSALNEIAKRDSLVVVSMPANSGQHRAVLHGLRHARGRKVVVLDADLQDPPEAIPLLLDRLHEGFAAVYASRRGQFQSLSRRLTSRAFKISLRVLFGFPDDMGLFVAMDRRMIEELFARTPTGRPFIPGMMIDSGLPVASVPVVRSPRTEGHSAYTSLNRLTMGVSVIAGISAERYRARLRSLRGPKPRKS